MTAGDREGNAVQDAGIVLICIGLAVAVFTLLTNAKTSFPQESDLIPAHGILERVRVESFASRTADAKWVILDIDVGTPEAPAQQRWILPDYSVRFEERIRSLEVGQRVTGRVEVHEKKIRGSDQAVRVLWSVEQGGEVVLPLSLVVDVEEEIHHHSPAIGGFVSGLGIVCVLLARRFAKKEGAHS